MSELSFEQMLEDSVKTIRNGEIVQGTVIDVKDDEIILNIGYKADGIITKSEYSNDQSLDLTTVVSVGDSIKQGQIIALVGPKNVYGVSGNLYKDSNGNFHHYFRGKGAFNVNLSNGAYISVQVRTPKVITDRGTYSLLNNTTAYKTTSSEESFNEPNDNEIIDFIKNNSKIIPSEIRTLNDEANVIDYLTVAIDENIYVSESNKVEALWKAVNYLLNKIENLGGNNVQ